MKVPQRPTPKQFASACTTQLARALGKESHGRAFVSKHDVSVVARRTDDLAAYADNALHALDARGKKSMRLEIVLHDVYADAFKRGRRVADWNGTIPPDAVDDLPDYLRTEFLLLRGQLPAGRATPTPYAMRMTDTLRSRAMQSELTGPNVTQIDPALVRDRGLRKGLAAAIEALKSRGVAVAECFMVGSAEHLGSTLGYAVRAKGGPATLLSPDGRLL